MVSDSLQTLAPSGTSTAFMFGSTTSIDGSAHSTDLATRIRRLEERIDILETVSEVNNRNDRTNLNSEISSTEKSVGKDICPIPAELERILAALVFLLLWLCVGMKYVYATG